MKRFLIFLLLAATSMLVAPEAIHAELPYRTAYYDSNQSTWLRIQRFIHQLKRREFAL